MADEPAKPDFESIVKGAVQSAVTAIRKDVIEPLEAEFKKLTTSHADLVKNQDILATTLSKLPPAAAAKPGEAAPAGDATVAKPLTQEDINKAVIDALKARDDAASQSSQQAEAKKALREKIVKEKLAGDPKLAALLPDTADEAALTAAADGLVNTIKTYKPDFGGTAVNGGTAPATDTPKPLNPNLSEGVAKLAAGLKFDTSAAPSPAATK